MFVCLPIFGQNSNGSVGINTNTPNPNTVLDIVSGNKNKGVLIPRLTSAERDAIVINQTNDDGLTIYNTTENCFNYWSLNNSEWKSLCGNSTVATINSLDCSNSQNIGNLTSGIAASGVSTTINYVGGNGGVYNEIKINSTGVTGLTATLSSGTLDNGNGSLTFNITGTPSGGGTASFAINFGGQNCTISRSVILPSINVRVARFGQFTIGDSNFSAFNAQLNSTANYGPSGTYKNATQFTFTDITTTLATTSGATLKANYDILNIGYLALTTTEAQNLKDFANLGGVVIINLDATGVNFTNAMSAFGNSGSTAAGNTTVYTTANQLSTYFGSITSGVVLTGADTSGKITLSQLASGSTVFAYDSSNNAGIWTVGGYNGRVIYIWDEGIFRNATAVTGAIDTNQEKFIHNLMAYAIDKARGL